jgi:catechol 2,3-dioxygenase-like lactoylglutathione lyase family enzyme
MRSLPCMTAWGWRVLGLLASAGPLLAQLAAPNDHGVSLGHVHLMVEDPEVQKKLWVGVLGAEVVHAGTLEMWKFPGIFLIVGKAKAAPSGGTVGSTVNHFGFLVKSYGEMKLRVVAAGLPIATDNANAKQLMVDFPDGVRVEFTEDATLKTPIAMHHIHLSTPDMEAQRAWYAKTFGGRAGERGAFYAVFLPGGEVDFRKADHAEAATKGRSLDHIGFEVKGLEAFCKKLESEGVKFEIPYREMPQLGGLKLAFLVDPEGTRIELTEGLGGARPVWKADRH